MSIVFLFQSVYCFHLYRSIGALPGVCTLFATLLQSLYLRQYSLLVWSFNYIVWLLFVLLLILYFKLTKIVSPALFRRAHGYELETYSAILFEFCFSLLVFLGTRLPVCFDKSDFSAGAFWYSSFSDLALLCGTLSSRS